MMTVSVPALAAEYNIGAPDAGMFANPTSVEQVTVVGSDSTDSSNIDRSKNSALIPPAFGSPESYQLGSGMALLSQLSDVSSGSGISAGTNDTADYPPAVSEGILAQNVSGNNLFTLPDDLYYADGSIGRLKIPSIGVDVKVYENESLENLAKGAGHFKSTSCWDGNVGLAGHNRGVANHFGKIHTLEKGNRIIYTTKLGIRTYEVFYVGKIEETDFSRLDRTDENQITLITCVRDVRNMRWCVQAREVG